MALNTKRRWLRFNLRTLMICVTIFCVWLGHSLNWIDRRREAPYLYPGGVELSGSKRAPLSLWLLGEKGVVAVNAKAFAASDDGYTTMKLAEERRAHLQKLFPEAEVGVTRFSAGQP